MKRTWSSLLAVGFAAWLSAPGLASAAPSPIAKVLGNLQWGMSELEVKNALKGKANGVSQASFDGGRARTDGTVVGEEYTHGNGETMLSYKDKDAENYLFFIGGELWKWVKVYPASTFRGGFTAAVKKRFGKGYEKSGEVNAGSGASYSYVEFLDRNTRLRAVDKSADYRVYVLMFESMDTVRELSALRTDTIRRGTAPKKASMAKKPAPAREERDDVDQERALARRSGASGGSSSESVSNVKAKKSLFANEQKDESDEEYAARKERLRAEAREAQRREHERGEEQKKGKILDELAGIDDDDPMSGMK